MMDNAEFERKVIELIAKWRYLDLSEISGRTEINYGLGIDGDDVDDLLDYIFDEFGWPKDQDIDLSNYFFSEHEMNIFLQIASLFRRDRRKKLPLTVSKFSEILHELGKTRT